MELIQTPPILGDIKMANVSPIIDGLHIIKVVRVNDNEDAIVMEVEFCKGEDILKVVFTPLVLC